MVQFHKTNFLKRLKVRSVLVPWGSQTSDFVLFVSRACCMPDLLQYEFNDPHIIKIPVV
jgi:hypothetical protein